MGKSVTDEEIENYPLAVTTVADKDILSRKSYPALVTKKKTNSKQTKQTKISKKILQHTFL